MQETPNKDAHLNRQPWEPAGVVSVDDSKNDRKQNRTLPDKGSALKLEVENALHDEGLMQGEKRG